MKSVLSYSSSFRHRVIWLIAITTIIRMITASVVELGNDEAYYWTYSQKLQWNYFDHPPMVAVWIRMFTGNLWLQQYELFIRLGSIVSCALSTWLIFVSCRLLHSEKAGWIAACLFNASVYASIIAGIFILPDSPQMIFWCCSLYLIILIFHQPDKWLPWLLLGVASGLCIMSKVHGIFIWTGMGLYILFYKRRWFRLPQFYVSLTITVLLICPILIWNIQNSFITYHYHIDRVAIHDFKLNTNGFLRELFGQITYTNPVNFVLIISGIIFLRRKNEIRFTPLTVFLLIALPMAGVLLVTSIFRDTLPHWSGPAYVTLIPFAAIYLSSVKFSFFPKIIKGSLALCSFILLAGVIITNYYPGTLGGKNNPEMGKRDVTLDMHGWKILGKEFSSLYAKDTKAGIMPYNCALISNKWFPAAHEDYYICLPEGIQLIGFGSMIDLHHYMWMNEWRKRISDLSSVYCIVPSNEFYNVKEKYGAFYGKIYLAAVFNDWRGYILARRFYIYRLMNWNGKLPSFDQSDS